MTIRLFDSYKKVVATAWAAWLSTGAVVTARAFEVIPQQYSTLAILPLGIGIATSVSLSRYKLTEAIVRVFEVGAALGLKTPPASGKKLPNAAADRLLAHVKRCADCRSDAFCSAKAALIKETLEERHGV